jgi:hypothetical protein
MYAVVHDVHAIDLVLGIQICIEALLDVLHNRTPRSIVVHKVTKAGGINNGQTETNAILLDVRAD